MSENTPPTFEFLDQLLTEIRSRIFGYMVQDTIQSQHQKWKHNLVLDLWGVKSHLNTSLWITLNKQYCAEYLRVFLKQVELRADIRHLGWRNAVKANEPSVLENCLKIIDHRLKISGPQVNFKESNKALGTYMRGICLTHDSTLLMAGYNWSQYMYRNVEENIAKPLKQLRRHSEEDKIPGNKVSIHIPYGDPDAAFSAFQSANLSATNHTTSNPLCIPSKPGFG